jgi:hypothetical protein
MIPQMILLMTEQMTELYRGIFMSDISDEITTPKYVPYGASKTLF